MTPEGDGVESENTGCATKISSLKATTRALFSPPALFPLWNLFVEPAAMYKQTGLILKNADNDASEDHGLKSENTGYATTTSSSLQAMTSVLFSPSTRSPLCPRDIDICDGFREFVADGSAQ